VRSESGMDNTKESVRDRVRSESGMDNTGSVQDGDVPRFKFGRLLELVKSALGGRVAHSGKCG
jgi:hypothetical protein